jgi:transposase
MPIRTYKIKLKNTYQLKTIFQKWFYDYKYTYNKSIWMINDSSVHYSKFDLKNTIVPKSATSRIPWVLETPKDIRAEACFEASKNLDLCLTNLKNKHQNHFTLGFKKKKKLTYCFGLPGSAIKVINNKCITIYTSYTDSKLIYLSENLSNDVIDSSSHLKSSHKIYFNGKDFYLLLSFEKPIKPIIEMDKRKKVVAIDLGVRKMATTWSPDSCSYNFGNRKTIQIKDLLLKKSYYHRIGNTKQMNSIEIRLKNLQKELHHSTSTFLCKRYRNIIVPKLDVKKLVEKSNSKEYNKAMLRLSLCEFIKLLKAKGELYNTRILTDSDGVHERYSSRMCSRCRFINPKS